MPTSGLADSGQEKRISWLATLTLPPSAIKLKTLRRLHSSDHPRLPLTGPLPGPSTPPSAPFPTPSRSLPPATLTKAGLFACLHMQMKTFAYGAPQGGSPREPFSCLPSALSLGTCQGWGGGRAGGVKPPGLARWVPGGLEEVLPWRRHAPHPLPGPGSRAPCLWFSSLPTTSAPIPRSPTEILHRPLAAQLGTEPGFEM